MRRRFLAAVAALVLLVAGTGVLLAYVRGADSRALAGTRTVDVLVVDQLIPAGTAGGDLAHMVRTELVPAKVALPGRVTDLTALDGRVAAVDLQPGEQLLASRFERPRDLQAPGTVAVPAGLQEVSVLLEPQRAVGGRLAAGDTVGVVLSMGAQGPGQTHAVLHHVLVTQIQGAPAPADSKSGTQTASSGSPAPTQSLLLTLAVSAAQAEAVVFGMEHGTLWLTLEPKGAITTGTTVLTQDNIYGKSFR
ncbi:MAG TPA: RcpC/CpaB family pilus assembly protein [Blastococcus sp.]|nr:RcpC/CpaB family pilus assembly protein [Blastococcus sp.]